jgi:hypothetical protein
MTNPNTDAHDWTEIERTYVADGGTPEQEVAIVTSDSLARLVSDYADEFATLMGPEPVFMTPDPAETDDYCDACNYDECDDHR